MLLVFCGKHILYKTYYVCMYIRVYVFYSMYSIYIYIYICTLQFFKSVGFLLVVHESVQCAKLKLGWTHCHDNFMPIFLYFSIKLIVSSS